MTAVDPSAWEKTTAVAACPLVPWAGDVWRCHTRRYAGDNADGSLKTTGRYHRGRDKFPTDETWLALYTALAKHIALGERLRHTRPEALALLNGQRISRLRVELRVGLDACSSADCLDCSLPGLTRDALCHPADYGVAHAVANAVRDRGAEGLLVPSCTRFRGGNLIVFVDRLLPGSGIAVVDAEDPDLFVDWRGLS